MYESNDTCIDFTTTLHAECLVLPYSDSFKGHENTHQGQKKLFISEVQFLTEYYRSFHKIDSPHPVIVYAGAAPFHHGQYLHELFKDVHFILFDPNAFDASLQNLSAFETVNRMFTQEDAQYFKAEKRPLLFISDIRSSHSHPKEFEFGVAEQMQCQSDWVKTMTPTLSLLKFRMPYLSKEMVGDSLLIGKIVSRFPIFKDYPNVCMSKGDLLFQVNAPPTSGETRLMISINDINTDQHYNFDHYEKVMSFHNQFTRTYKFTKGTSEFNHVFDARPNQYCRCYDCVAELKVIQEYLDFAMQPHLRSLEQVLARDTLRNMLCQFPFAKVKMNAETRLTLLPKQNADVLKKMKDIDKIIYECRV